MRPVSETSRSGPTHGLSHEDYTRLTTYNAERDRGICHTQAYRAWMGALQRHYDQGLTTHQGDDDPCQSSTGNR